MDDKNLEIKSDDVQEILGTPPSWLVQWGTILMALVLLGLTLVFWKLEYPDEVRGDLVLRTSNPPKKVVAKADGFIAKLLIKENAKVEKGDQLLVMENAAKYDDIQLLGEHLDSIELMNSIDLINYNPTKGLELGELQKEYIELDKLINNLKKSSRKLIDMDEFAEYDNQIIAYKEDIKKLTERKNKNIEILRDRETTLNERKKVYSKDVKNPSYKSALYEASANLRQTQDKIDENEFDINRLEDQIRRAEFLKRGLQKGARGQNKDLLDNIQRQKNIIRQEIKNWEKTNILLSPISGTLLLKGYYDEEKFYQRGKPVVAILLDGDQEIIAQATIPVENANDVQAGQIAHLKLSNFPSITYGFLTGTVKSKKNQFQEGNCLVQIQLDNGMTSSKGEDLLFEPNMIGQVEIITEDRNVLERLFGKASKLLF